MSRSTSPGEVLSAPDFQKDGEEFFKQFDKIQYERDNNFVRRLKDGLDAMLIYAGLFSAVNSAFLVYTLPNLKADPADDTNALLYQLILLGTAQNQSAEIYLPSDTFSPDPNDLLVNRLFSFSLFISLLGSFTAVLGRYWLAYYQENGEEGVECERWKQLNRSLAAKRWGLAPMLEHALPFTLIVALSIFATGAVLQLATLDSTSGLTTTLPIGFMIGLFGGGLFFRLSDPFCPYRTPFEGLIKWAGYTLLTLIMLPVRIGIKLAEAVSSICNWLGVRIRATVQQSQENNTNSNSRHHEDDQRAEGQTERIDGHIRLQMQTEIPDSNVSDANAYPQKQPTGSVSIPAHDIPKKAPKSSPVPSLQYRTPEFLHSHAISRALNESEDSCTLYQAAANLCSISGRSLEIVFNNQVSRNRLEGLLRNAVRALDRSRRQAPLFTEIGELKMSVVVFGTAILHLYFSTGNAENLPNCDITIAASPPQPSTGSLRRARKENYRELKGILQLHWHLQNDKFGHQPPVFTSTSLAAGLLMGCLDSNESVFHQESESLTYRLDSVSSEGPGLWNQLALLAMACNTRGGRTMSEKRQEGFQAIQDAYTTKKPTPELADAVHQAIRSHTGEKTRLPCEVFKLAWKLFVHGREKGDAARAFGHHVPFLGILEAKVRDDEQPESYQSYFRDLRSGCFEVVLDTVRSIPSGDRVNTSASWRFQAKFVFRAVGHYAMCIMALGDVRHAENDEALGFIRCVKALVPPGPSQDGGPSNPVGGQSDSEKEYRSELEAFEDICQAFEVFIRSGQIKKRLAPEDRWCFAQNELDPSP